MASPGPGKILCGAQLPNQPQGRTCRNIAGKGTDHKGAGRCSRHLGCTPTHVAAARVQLARMACATLGVPVDIHPAEALIGECCETAGNVAYYRALVQQLPTHPEPDEYIQGEEAGHWERGEPGVYGRTYHVSGVPTGEAKPHILVTLYNEERKHLLAATTAALKAGVDAARVQIAEREASLIAEGFLAFAVACGLDPAAPKVREAFRAQLTLIAGGRAA